MIPIDYGTIAAGNLIFSIIAFATAAAILLGRSIFAECPPILKILAVLAVDGFAELITLQLLSPSWQLVIPLLLGLFLAIIANRLLKGVSFTGSLLMATQAQFYFACLFWALSIVAMAEVDPLTRSLMFVVFVLASLYIIIALVQRSEQTEVICRRDWRWPRVLPAVVARSHYPKVSLHVPIYSEPPELVMATLNALAELEYPDYEVLVIDNNTRDPALWRPVQMHCQRLGERFRFFHVDDLPGAKAGALNLALRHTAADAELIGVVDSDYKVKRNFISSLVGYFDDPMMGFVQTPQAYRDWQGYSYLRMCNWEYTLYFVSTLVSRNERMAAITLGTMGLIRRKLVEEIGGWAEWCVTEDSEIALRIHAHGYRSVYINTAFGKGLIPESFRDYKKQRFRWCYGAIQELRRHFRLFLPKLIAQASPLTALQKISHLMHALDTLKSGLEFLLLIFGAALVTSMLLHEESIQVPLYVWPIFSIAAIAVYALKWHVFRALGWSFKDTLGAYMAHLALDHTIAMAGLLGLLTRNIPWRKTNKFPAFPTGFLAFSAVIPELFLGSIILVASVELLRAGRSEGLLVLLLIGGLLKGAKYLFAPLLVILAEHGVRQRAESLIGAPKS